MFSFLDRVGIGAKLPVLIGLLVAMTIGVSGVQSYLSMRSALADEATARLTAIGEQHADQIKDLLHKIDRDLEHTAGDPQTTDAIIAFLAWFDALETPRKFLQNVDIEENPHPAGKKHLLVAAPDVATSRTSASIRSSTR